MRLEIWNIPGTTISKKLGCKTYWGILKNKTRTRGGGGDCGGCSGGGGRSTGDGSAVGGEDAAGKARVGGGW